MIGNKKDIKSLKWDVANKNSEPTFGDKLDSIISTLYEERFLEKKRETDIMLEKLIKATKGKELVVGNCK